MKDAGAGGSLACEINNGDSRSQKWQKTEARHSSPLSHPFFQWVLLWLMCCPPFPMEMVEETENKGDRARRRGYWKNREDQMCGLEEKFGVKIMGAGRNIVFSKRKGRERVEEKCFFLFK